MPILQDDNSVPDSSDGTLDEDFDIRGEGPETEVDGAASSDAQDVTGERSSLDVVQDVVKARDPAASSAEGQKEGEGAGQKASQTAKEPDNENYSDVPFHKHPRFQQLLKETKANREDAKLYRNVQGFLDQNGIKPDEAATSLHILALSKTNPVKAWEMLRPMVQQLLIDAGEVLPNDLQQRVQAGELSAEAAEAIAKERAGRTSAERTLENTQQRQERLQREERATAIHTAAVDWEADRKAKDPNFEAKQPQLMKELAWLHATEGKADTPAKVRDQLDRAYKAVATVAPAQRRPAAKAPTIGEATRQRPAASNGASKPAQTAQQPAGALKFIKAVVAQRGASA